MALGWVPIYDTLVLCKPPADWIITRELSSGTFPAGTTAWIKWDTGQTWNAVITSTSASWRVESTVHQVIADGTGFSIYVSYPDGGLTAEYEWFYGRARRVG